MWIAQGCEGRRERLSSPASFKCLVSVLALVVLGLVAPLLTGCGEQGSGEVTQADLAKMIKKTLKDREVEVLRIERKYAHVMRSLEDKGTAYLCRIRVTDKKGKVSEAKVEVFIAESDGWTVVRWK